MRTLIITDMQNDFMPGGSLAIPEGDKIIPVINTIQNYFDLVVATQDWHASNHTSFASNHENKKPFDKIMLHGKEQILWPNHCEQGSFGAEFHSALETRFIETIFRKATDLSVDSYSSFYDVDHQRTTGMAGYLRDKGSSDLYFCGLAADFCVYFSIKDALSEGFNCWLIEDATKAIDNERFKRQQAELLSLGVHFINSDAISYFTKR